MSLASGERSEEGRDGRDAPSSVFSVPSSRFKVQSDWHRARSGLSEWGSRVAWATRGYFRVPIPKFESPCSSLLVLRFPPAPATSPKPREKVERVKGIEPSWPVWKTGALPLSYTRVTLRIVTTASALSTHRRWPPVRPSQFLAVVERRFSQAKTIVPASLRDLGGTACCGP